MADTSRNPGDSANFEEVRSALRQMRGELDALRQEANSKLASTEQAATRAATSTERLAGEAAARKAATGGRPVEAAPATASDVSASRAAADAEAQRAASAEKTAQAKVRAGEADAQAARNLPAVVGRERLPLGEGAYSGVRATPAEAIQAYGQSIAQQSARIAAMAPPPIPLASAETRPGLRERLGGERMSAATNEEAAANARLSSELGNLSRGYGQVAYQSRVYGDALHRHGALTTEFLQALMRGEVTLREFGNELVLTAGKFAGWTIAATAIYGAARALGTLARGAIDAQSATRGLERFIPNLNQGQATSQLLAVSRQLNVPVADVGQSQQLFARVFPTETGSITAARTALLAYKLDQITVADSTRYLTAITQEFSLNADRLPGLFDQISAAQRRMGARVAETLPGIARSAAAVKNAGGDLSQLVALIATAQVASGQTGNTVGTAFTRSAANFIRTPASQGLLKQLGIDTSQGYTQTLIDAVRRAQTLSGEDRIALAKAIGGPQYGARIFQSLLNNDPRLERTLGVTSPAAARGSAAEELSKVLGQADEKIKQIGNSLQRIGAELAGGGFANGAALLLTTFDAILGDVDRILGLFDRLPTPLKTATSTALELGLAMRVLGKFGFGEQFAGVPVIGRAFNATPRALTEQRAALEGFQGLRADAAYSLQSAQARAAVEAQKLADLEAQGVAVEAETLEAQRAAAALALEKVDAAAEDLAITERMVVAKRAEVTAMEGSVPLVGGTAAAAGAGAAAATAKGTGEVAAGSEAVAAATAEGVVIQSRLAATGAFLTSLGSGLRAFLFNPLTLLFAGMAIVPAELNYRRQQAQHYNNTLDSYNADTSSRGTLQAQQAYLRSHRPPGTGPTDVFGTALHDTLHFDINPFDWESDVQKREQEQSAYTAAQKDLTDRLRTQDEAFAKGTYAPFLTLNQITGKLRTQIAAYRSGSISAAELDRDYQLAIREINHSAEATAGGAKNAKAVAAALHASRTSILEAAQGHAEIAKALQGAALDQIATSLQNDAEQITQFGATHADIAKVAQQYAAASAKFAQNPNGGTKPGDNLKAMKAAQTAVDNILSQLQQDLQQSLTLATTQGGRNSAYGSYEANIRTLITASRSKVSDARAQLSTARRTREQGQQQLERARKEYADAQKALDHEQQQSNAFNDPKDPLAPQYNPSDPTRHQNLDRLKKNVDDLKKKVASSHDAMSKATRAEHERELKLEGLLRDAETQAAQEQNSIRDLRAQLQAGREGDAATGLLDQLRAAQADLANDIRHHVGEQQRLQDELRVQQLQDQQLQAQVETIASRGQLAASHIDPTNTTAVDRANVRTLQSEILALRRGKPSPERNKQLRDLYTQLNALRFQAAADARTQAQDLINARFGLLESQTDDPVRQANLEVRKDRQLIGLAHTHAEKLTAQTNLNTALRSSYNAYVQSQLDEIDFRAHVGQITTDQEIQALQRLLHYSHLSRDARRNILTQIYDLQHQNQSDVELNVGNIKLPTLYDVRRLAKAGTSDPMTVNNINVSIDGSTDPISTANAVVTKIEHHTRTRLKGHHRAAGVR